MALLSPSETADWIDRTPGWQVVDGVLTHEFSFTDFLESMRFVNRVADAAEQAGHHPDIDIRYNKVRLGLVTHDAGGITAKDFELAGKISQILAN
jgi:4a-hydroxytetrahydrobiopterin dehydratase